jgi:hypothetical protein
MASHNRAKTFQQADRGGGKNAALLLHLPWDEKLVLGSRVTKMKFRLLLTLLLGAAVAALVFSAAGEQSASKTGPKYDTKNEVKIKGVIEDVRQVPGSFEGTYLVVKTESKSVVVRAAPADFLKEIDTTFNKGEQVEVLGCKAPDAPEEMLAREITIGQNTTTLRDDKGIPVWAGWKPSGK